MIVLNNGTNNVASYIGFLVEFFGNWECLMTVQGRLHLIWSILLVVFLISIHYEILMISVLKDFKSTEIIKTCVINFLPGSNKCMNEWKLKDINLVRIHSRYHSNGESNLELVWWPRGKSGTKKTIGNVFMYRLTNSILKFKGKVNHALWLGWTGKTGRKFLVQPNELSTTQANDYNFTLFLFKS